MSYTPPQETTILSTLNSDTTPLGTNGVYVGTAELNNYQDVMITLKTDTNGTLYTEFSPDGTNWDSSLSFVYDTTRINPPHVLVKGYRYFRVRYVNDDVAQGIFRLQTYYGLFNKLTSPINGTVSENYDAQLVRPTEYKHEVAMGKRQGRTLWNNFGYNLDVDTGAEEIIAPWGGVFTPSTHIITTAQTFTIAYNNTTDGSGQTGATQLLFTYLDANFLEKTAIHVLGSTGSDVTSFTGLGINRVVVLMNGGVGYNTNDITITATTAGTTQAFIPATQSVTQQCIFHTQINHNFLTEWLYINVRKLTSAGGDTFYTLIGYSWSRVTQTRYEIFRHNGDTSSNTLELNPTLPFVIGGREVLYFTLTTDTNNTVVSCRFSGIQERIS